MQGPAAFIFGCPFQLLRDIPSHPYTMWVISGWVWGFLSALLVFHGRNSQLSSDVPSPLGQGVGDRDSHSGHRNAKGVEHNQVSLRPLFSFGGFGKLLSCPGRCPCLLGTWVSTVGSWLLAWCSRQGIDTLSRTPSSKSSQAEISVSISDITCQK